MKRLRWLFYTLFFVAVAGVMIKLTIPLSFKEVPIRVEALEHVDQLQLTKPRGPDEVALAYHFFGTDYQSQKYPDWIEASSTRVDDETVRVTIYDPRCQDDSIHRSIDRYFMQKDQDGMWLPIKADFSHTGRGKFGWTTEPTN